MLDQSSFKTSGRQTSLFHFSKLEFKTIRLERWISKIFLFQECIKTGRFNSPTPSNLTDNRPPSNASGPSRVSYNDLCFPKTANYGSMRKSGRCDIESKLGGPLPSPPVPVMVLPPMSQATAMDQQNSIYHLQWFSPNNFSQIVV